MNIQFCFWLMILFFPVRMVSSSAFQLINESWLLYARLHLVFSSPKHLLVAGGCIVVMEIIYKLDFSLAGFLICLALLGWGMYAWSMHVVFLCNIIVWKSYLFPCKTITCNHYYSVKVIVFPFSFSWHFVVKLVTLPYLFFLS